MAIYSLNMRSIGRRTHAEGTAGAHIRYIAREDAEPHLMSRHMPEEPGDARAFLDRGERADRKNARVVDKIRIALPLELNGVQRAQLVQDFAESLTEGRVPWYAAIHQTGKDAHNPHVHLVIRDRDIETGKRHVRLSDSARDWQKAGRPEEHPVQHVRKLWEQRCNAALELEGVEARINRRTLEAQGIERTPQIHVGPQAQHVDMHKRRPESREAPERSWRRTQYRDATPYPDIDLGRTRKERNAEIVDFNIEKAARSPDFETRKWAEFEREQIAKDRVLERMRTAEARRQERERDQVRGKAREAREDIQARRADEQAWAQIAVERFWEAKRVSQVEEQRHRESALQEAQARFAARFLRVVDITGRTREAQDKERAELEARQARERQELDAQAKREHAMQQDAVKARYAAEFLEVRARRRAELRALEDRHSEAVQRQQLELQYREFERSQAQEAMAKQIAEWKRTARDQEQQERKAQAAGGPTQPGPQPQAQRKPANDDPRPVKPEPRAAAPKQSPPAAPPQPAKPEADSFADRARTFMEERDAEGPGLHQGPKTGPGYEP